jgi:hypothetical protein
MSARGIAVKYLTPLQFKTLPMPGYGEIRLSRTRAGPVHEKIEAAGADAIHIATEGPLSPAAIASGTASPFHRLPHAVPEYLRARLPVPLRWSYRYMRWFHGPARLPVGTAHLKKLLKARLHQRRHLVQGVDTELFCPDKRVTDDARFPLASGLPLCGPRRVEKNIEPSSARSARLQACGQRRTQPQAAAEAYRRDVPRLSRARLRSSLPAPRSCFQPHRRSAWSCSGCPAVRRSPLSGDRADQRPSATPVGVLGDLRLLR